MAGNDGVRNPSFFEHNGMEAKASMNLIFRGLDAPPEIQRWKEGNPVSMVVILAPSGGIINWIGC
jgi:hypothetical protein